jgi:trimethylamine--corrinoid protein Co-methyltransferase
MGGSLEKMLMDIELYEYVSHFMRPWKIGEGDLALEAIKEIGPKGNFLNHPLTFKRFRTEFYEPQVFNRESYGHWQKRAAGARPNWLMRRSGHI